VTEGTPPQRSRGRGGHRLRLHRNRPHNRQRRGRPPAPRVSKVVNGDAASDTELSQEGLITTLKPRPLHTIGSEDGPIEVVMARAADRTSIGSGAYRIEPVTSGLQSSTRPCGLSRDGR
jgi:hypothetical protein